MRRYRRTSEKNRGKPCLRMHQLTTNHIVILRANTSVLQGSKKCQGKQLERVLWVCRQDSWTNKKNPSKRQGYHRGTLKLLTGGLRRTSKEALVLLWNTYFPVQGVCWKQRRSQKHTKVAPIAQTAKKIKRKGPRMEWCEQWTCSNPIK